MVFIVNQIVKDAVSVLVVWHCWGRCWNSWRNFIFDVRFGGNKSIGVCGFEYRHRFLLWTFGLLAV